MELIIIMGPSGAGKSSVSRALAQQMNIPFLEGDEFHPQTNREKMAAGRGLDHADRVPWIAAMAAAASRLDQPRVVLACSALYAAVRDGLRATAPTRACRFFLLDVPEVELARRLDQRRGHFVGPYFLAGQLAAMDDCEDAIRIDAARPVPDVVADIISRFS